MKPFRFCSSDALAKHTATKRNSVIKSDHIANGLRKHTDKSKLITFNKYFGNFPKLPQANAPA